MTYEQFWYEDVCLTKIYREAFEIKEKREAIKTKWTIWEQGLYIYEALCDVSPILRAFSKASKPLQYPKEPYEIDKYYEDENKTKQEKRQKEQEKIDKIKAQIYFQNWAKAAQKRFKEEGG